MEPIRITPAHDPDIQIPFEIPIKGRKALTFTVPRLHYLPIQVMEDFEKWLQQRAERTDVSPAVLAATKGVDETEKMLELLLPAEKFALIKKLTLGEKLQIDQEWKRLSTIELGKSEASPTSSATAS